MNIFRDLTPNEITNFEKWADDNFTPFTEISGSWHPVVQARCAAINAMNEKYAMTLTKSEWDEVVGWLRNGNYTSGELADRIEKTLTKLKERGK